MRSSADTVARIRDEVIIGVVRFEDPAYSAMVARTYADSGLECIEITMTTPGALELITELAYQHRESDMVLAAGSVRETDEVDQVAEAGAAVVVSPHLSERVIERTLERGLVSVAGASTPSEIIRARELGAHVVKIYPARLLGGPEYFRTIRQPIRGVDMLAGGPVETDEIEPYLDAGAIAVNMGGAFAPLDLVEANDWGAVGDRIAEAKRVVSGWKERNEEE